MSVFPLPLHKLFLESDLFSRVVKMDMCLALPVKGIWVIKRNDVAGSHVWPVHSARPILAPALVDQMKIKKLFPEVFKAWAVTCAMTKVFPVVGGAEQLYA